MTLSLELRFVLVALATWRLTHLLAAEDGPGDVVVRLRARLGDSVAGRAMDCFYCLSLWIAGPLALVAAQGFFTWLLAWLAASAAACLLERATSREADHQSFKRAGGAGGSHELLWTAAPGAADAAESSAGRDGPAAGAPARSGAADLPR